MLEIAIQRFLADVLLNMLMIQPTKSCGRYYGKPIFLSGRCHTTCCVCFLFNFISERQKENKTDV